jgi:hypothetical protein
MLKTAKIWKCNLCNSSTVLVKIINFGTLSILKMLRKLELRASTRSSDSISIDHSTLCQNFHSTELLICIVLVTCGIRDGRRISNNKCGTSKKRPRPSTIGTGRTSAWLSEIKERVMTS